MKDIASHQLPQCLLLLHRKLRPTARGFDIDEANGAMFIEAMHPVPQCLTVHAANPGRHRSIHPIVDRS